MYLFNVGNLELEKRLRFQWSYKFVPNMVVASCTFNEVKLVNCSIHHYFFINIHIFLYTAEDYTNSFALFTKFSLSGKTHKTIKILTIFHREQVSPVPYLGAEKIYKHQ